jgi:phosphatidate cytidylyltransferase
MLKQRIVTALILAALFLLALIYLPLPLFSAFAALVVLIGAWEWANLAGFPLRWQRAAYVVVTLVILAVLAFWLDIATLGAALGEARFEAIQGVLLLACIWWAVALLWVQTYPHSALLWGYRPLRAVMGLLVLVPAWVALTYVRSLEQGAWLLLLMIAIVACADIGGYFTGRRWGRRKLAPAVSPGKTWEGFAGGVGANLLLTLLIWLWVGGSYWLWLALILPASLVSVLGDLLESMLKRHRGIKDSSRLLPGHGGVLDRIDSLTAAAPVFALVLLTVGAAG